MKFLKDLGGKKFPQNHKSNYLTQELIILLTKQNVSGKNLQIILQMRVVFPGNGNAQELIFKHVFVTNINRTFFIYRRKKCKRKRKCKHKCSF